MILVCGASGTTGGATVAALLEAGAPVRAMTRDPAAYDAPAGVEVVQGDFADAPSLARALDGVERAYLAVNESEEGRALRVAFLDAARAAGVSQVAYLSAYGAGERGVRFCAQHGEVEDHLRTCGLRWTVLRPNAFLQNYLGQAGAVAHQGAIYSPLGAETAVSNVDARDVGAVAATVLTERGHANETYLLTGPQAVTDAEVAAAIGAALGREVAHVQVPVEAACGAMLEHGAHPYMVGLLPELWSFYEAGRGAQVSGDVERLLGRPARDARQFAEDHAAAFGR